MTAESFLNLVQGGNSLIARLPVPEHDEALPANAAVGLSISYCGLAEYLHIDTSRRDGAQFVP